MAGPIVTKRRNCYSLRYLNNNNSSRKKIFFFFQICCIWFLLLGDKLAVGMEAKWTPADDNDGNGPLPLSSNVREQLLQLEEVIRTSPDPQATLERAAQQNNMSPQELLNMLERNRSDLQQGGGGGGGGRRSSSIVIKLLSSIGVVITQTATKNPKSFILATTSVLLLLILLWNIPRNGIILSTNRSVLLSKGPTTMFQPPDRYLTKLLEAPPLKWRLSSSLKQQPPPDADYDSNGNYNDEQYDIESILFNELSMNNYVKQLEKQVKKQGEGGIWLHKPSSKQSNFLQAVTYQIHVPMDAFVDKQTTRMDRDDYYDDDSDDDQLEEVMDLSFHNAVNVLSSQSLAEFFPPSKQIRLQTKRQNSILVVKKLGDYRRYGLVPMQLTYESSSSSPSSPPPPPPPPPITKTRQEEDQQQQKRKSRMDNNNDRYDDDDYKNDNQTYTTIYTFLKGAPWVGQLHVNVRQSSSSSSLIVQVSILVPKKMDEYGLIGVNGRKLSNKKLAYKVVETIAKSISSSIRTRTKQSLSRRKQSNRFQTKASGHATYRRNVRFQKEKEIEEMAAERRRKWQRGGDHNSGGRRYRPTGERMKSPNNC